VLLIRPWRGVQFRRCAGKRLAFSHCGFWSNGKGAFPRLIDSPFRGGVAAIAATPPYPQLLLPGLGYRIPDPDQLSPPSFPISPPVDAAVRDPEIPLSNAAFVAILRIDSVRLSTRALCSGSSIAIPLASPSVLIIFHLDQGSIPAIPNHTFTVRFGHRLQWTLAPLSNFTCHVPKALVHCASLSPPVISIHATEARYETWLGVTPLLNHHFSSPHAH
jgi:hypothetical protein